MNEFRLNNHDTALVNSDVYDWIYIPEDDMLTNLSNRNKHLENILQKYVFLERSCIFYHSMCWNLYKVQNSLALQLLQCCMVFAWNTVEHVFVYLSDTDCLHKLTIQKRKDLENKHIKFHRSHTI